MISVNDREDKTITFSPKDGYSCDNRKFLTSEDLCAYLKKMKIVPGRYLIQ